MVCIPIQAKFPRLRKQVKLSKKMIGTLLIGCLLNIILLENIYKYVSCHGEMGQQTWLSLDLSTSKT